MIKSCDRIDIRTDCPPTPPWLKGELEMEIVLYSVIHHITPSHRLGGRLSQGIHKKNTIMCFSKQDVKLFDDLSWPLEINSINRSLWNDKCNYMDLDDCKNLNPNNYNLIVMQHNICSVLSNQCELLCETHLSKQTVGFVNIPNYTHVANYRTQLKGRGTSILIRNDIPFKRRKDLEIFTEKEGESTYIKITVKNGKQFIVGSLYCSPNTIEKPLLNHLSETLNKMKANKQVKEIIIGLDHNLDLLKSDQHTPTGKFLELMLQFNMLPTIMRPTRIISNSATLIDNVFISEKLQRSFNSCVLVNNMSNHLLTLTLLKQTKLVDKSPLVYKSRKLTDVKIQTIKTRLKESDWNGLLNSEDCNINFNRLNEELKRVMDDIALEVTVRISGHRKFVEPWMMKGIETSNSKCQKLYRKMLAMNCSLDTQQKYRAFRNILNRVKR